MPQKASSRDWTLRIPAPFLDARANPIGHRRGWMLLILEGFCRARCYCWAGNAALAKQYGCTENNLLALLKEMESEGLIHRVATERGRPGRVGIILLRRANADLPTASPEEVPEVIRLMRESKSDHRDRARGQSHLLFPEQAPVSEDRELVPQLSATSTPVESVSHDPSFLGAKTPVFWGHHDPSFLGANKESFSSNKDEVKSEGPEGGPGLPTTTTRESKPEPKPAPSAAASTPPTVAEMVSQIGATLGSKPSCLPAAPLMPMRQPPKAAPPPPVAPGEPTPGLTAGQLAFLASLTPDQREHFDSRRDTERAKILAPHRPGLDRVCAEESIWRLTPRAPIPPDPTTTADLLHELPNGQPHWPHLAAEALARDFGGRQDRKLWRAFLHVTTAVFEGRFPAAAVLDAYYQSMNPTARNRGAVFNTVLKRNGWVW